MSSGQNDAGLFDLRGDQQCLFDVRHEFPMPGNSSEIHVEKKDTTPGWTCEFIGSRFGLRGTRDRTRARKDLWHS